MAAKKTTKLPKSFKIKMGEKDFSETNKLKMTGKYKLLYWANDTWHYVLK